MDARNELEENLDATLADGDVFLEDDLAAANALLGPADAVFRADRRRTNLSALIGFALIIGAVIANYIWWFKVRGGFGHLQFHFLIMPLVLGVGILAFLYHHRGLRVAVFSTGILRLRRNDVESVPFDEVKILRLRTKSAVPVIEYDETSAISACFLPISVPTFRIWEAWIELERGVEEIARFRPAVGEFSEFAELVQRKLFTRQWPELVERFERGETIVFDTLRIDRRGLTSGTRSMSWAEVGEMKLESNVITIGRKDSTWRSFWAHEISTIPNPHLAFALVNWLKQPRLETRKSESEDQE